MILRRNGAKQIVQTVIIVNWRSCSVHVHVQSTFMFSPLIRENYQIKFVCTRKNMTLVFNGFPAEK